MGKNNLLTLAIALTVGVILAGSLLMPVLSDYTTATRTYTNEGVPYASFDGETHTIVLSYDGTTTTITTDGEPCELPDLNLYGSATIVYGSDAIIRIGKTGNVRGFSDSFYGVDATAGNDATIVVTSTVTTLTVGNTTRTVPLTPLAYIASEGDYRLSLKPCITDDNVIIGGTTNTSGGHYINTVAVGQINDLTIANPFSDLGTGVTITSIDATPTTSAVVGNLLKIENISFNAELSDSSEVTAIFSYFLAPASVVYNDPNYLGDANAAILGAIPVLVIVALITMALGSMYLKRDD